MLILQSDPEIYVWVMNLERMRAGSFLRAIGLAAQHADIYNYALMRPLLLNLMNKYPDYAKTIGCGA